MNDIAPLLHSFYNGTISAQQRATLHAQLLHTLKTPQCINASAEYIQSASTPTASVDPLLLHYALHAIESLARTSFAATPPQLRANLQKLLVDFLIASFSRNANLPSASHPAPIPAYAINKAARVAVELGKREWIADSTHHFPRLILALIDQNGHTAASLPRIFTGMSLVTVLVEDSLDSSRKDLLSSERSTLLRLVRQIADAIVAALEIGVRINGPAFPRHVPIGAVRAIGSLLRVETSVVADAIAVLKRSVQGRVDLMGAETLAVLAECFGEGKILLPPDWGNTLAHAAALLEPVAMGDAAVGQSEDVCLYRLRLIAYGEAVSRRVIALRPNLSVLERILNAMMGVTARWASESPDQFPAAMDSWMNILEALEDAEVDSDDLLEKVYHALSQLCVHRCMHSTNSTVLQSLEESNERREQQSGGVYEWDEMAELMAEVAIDPSLSTMLFPIRDDADEFSCSRSVYVGKCVETLLACARMSSRVAIGTADFARQVLQNARGDDLQTALQVAFCVASLLPSDSEAGRALLQTVCELIGSGGQDVMLLRTTALLLRIVPAQYGREVGGMLAGRMGDILRSSSNRETALGACLVLLELARCTDLFTSQPPITLDIIARGPKSVSSLGAAAVVRWALVPPRDAKGLPVRWTEEQWTARREGYQAMCGSLFAEFVTACRGNCSTVEAFEVLVRGAGMFRAMLLAVATVQGETRDSVWCGGGAELTAACLQALHGLENVKEEGAEGVMVCLLSTLGTAVHVCARQRKEGASILNEAAGLGTRAAQGGRLAEEALRMVRDGLVDGREELVDAGVQLAVREIGGIAGVMCVSVISEVLRKFWMSFWPDDVPEALRATQRTKARGRGIFFAGFEGLVGAMGSADLAVCRAALLALLSLHASRRLLARAEACPLPMKVQIVSGCLHVCGVGGMQKGSVGEEAIEIVWQVAKADLDAFYRNDGVLKCVWKGVAAGADDGAALIDGMCARRAGDHGDFVREIRALVNDVGFLEQVRAGPSL